MPFVGHIFSRDGVQADPAKSSAVRQCPVPISVTEVKSFWGLCSAADGTFAISQQVVEIFISQQREREISIEFQKPNRTSDNCKIASPCHFFDPSPQLKFHSSSTLKQVTLPSAPAWPKYRMASSESFATILKPSKNSKSSHDHIARTFSHSKLHKTLQTLPAWPTIQHHYEPRSAPVVP